VKQLRTIGPLLQLSWVVAFSILIPLGIGLWLDRRFGTAPLLTLVGALVGILASTVGAVRIATRTIEALGQPPESGADDAVNGKGDRA
jgi:F0F1-type ATP synthase assembly protein I